MSDSPKSTGPRVHTLSDGTQITSTRDAFGPQVEKLNARQLRELRTIFESSLTSIDAQIEAYGKTSDDTDWKRRVRGARVANLAQLAIVNKRLEEVEAPKRAIGDAFLEIAKEFLPPCDFAALLARAEMVLAAPEPA